MKLIIVTFLFFGCVQTKQKQEDEIKSFNLPLKVSGDEKVRTPLNYGIKEIGFVRTFS